METGEKAPQKPSPYLLVPHSTGLTPRSNSSSKRKTKFLTKKNPDRTIPGPAGHDPYREAYSKKVLGHRRLPALARASQGQAQDRGPAALARAQAGTAGTATGPAENSRLFMSPVLQGSLVALSWVLLG